MSRSSSLGAEQVVEASRSRASAPPARREALVEAVMAGLFLAAALALAWSAQGPVDLETVVLVLGALAVAQRVWFEVGSAHTHAAILALIPAFFVLPPAQVPVVVAAAGVLERGWAAANGRTHPSRAWLAIGQSWYSLGPALVLTLWPGSPLRWEAFLAALAAYYLFDFVLSGLAERLAGGSPLSGDELRGFAWTYAIDLMLAPVGAVCAVAATRTPLAMLAVLPLCGLLALFATERRQRLDHAIELGHAYRGTALLLGDVVEADDQYTGLHSHDVVELSLAVARRLHLTPRQCLNVEFGALLHDVGKIRVPKEIINKPGPLDDEEWRIMKRHTIEGQLMLETVGGALSEVGRVVRASHEHFDGSGYPDGLAGDAIPIEARICSTCDAFSAMTTDRSYRAALPIPTAVAELRACTGTQFDPRVVEALVGVLEEQGRPTSPAVRPLTAA
jgi:HD-GYP domain-containing protein (c-di-GMP phosphodiesterase class II)